MHNLAQFFAALADVFWEHHYDTCPGCYRCDAGIGFGDDWGSGGWND